MTLPQKDSGISLPLADNWCKTKCKLTKVNFEWRIQVPFLESIPNWMGSIESSRFSSEETPNFEWYLDFASETSSYYPPHIVLNLNSTVEKRKNDVVRVNVKLAIVNKSNEKVFMEEQQFWVADKRHNYLYFRIGVQQLIESECIVNENLTIYCEIEQLHKETAAGNASDLSKYEPVRQPFSDSDQLLRNKLESLFQDTTFSDVTLSVRGCQFQAHKCILASSSKVFSAMFERHTRENITNQVVIEDIAPEVFHQLLRFVYTGRLTLTTMDVMAVGLYVAADKYLLDILKTECENHLRRHMSVDNCLELLIALEAEHHPASHLKEEAIKFFRFHAGDVMATDGWKKAKENHLAWLCNVQEMALCPDAKKFRHTADE